MTIDTSYQDSLPFLLAGNAGSIVIASSPNEKITVTLEYIRTRFGNGGGSSVEYSATFGLNLSSAGSFVLDLQKILLSIAHMLVPISSAAATGRPLYSYDIALTFESETGGETLNWMKSAYPGRLDDAFLEDIYEGLSFISSRPQISLSRMDGKSDRLPFVHTEDTTVSAILYFDLIPPVQINIAESAAAALSAVDVSFGAMRNAADDAGYSGQKFSAYDIFMSRDVVDDDGSTSTVKSEVLRFIVPDRKVTAFEFVSSAGTSEPIYAAGHMKTETKSEVKTFISKGVENEMTNDSSLVHETFTGHLASADEVRYWREFFDSSRRYALVDGDTRRITVTDIDSESTDGELNAFSFKWKFADRDSDPSRTPIRKELKQYRTKI